MQHIKMSFGYNSICFDRKFVLHTGKIRVKEEYGFITTMLNHCTQLQFQPSGNANQYTTISFATTCQQTNNDLIAEINAMLCRIMHARIDAKYAQQVWEPELVDWNHSDMHAEFLAM